MNLRILSAASFFLAIITLLASCQMGNTNYQEAAHNPDFVRAGAKAITDVIVHDVFSPPIASRTYAYFSVAGYEALRHDYPAYESLAGQLNGLRDIPQPDSSLEYCFPLASIQAQLRVGRALVFSEIKVTAVIQEMHEQFRELGVPEEVFERSVAYGDQMADHVLAWAATDNYRETRNMPKYLVSNDSASWQPTPPDYMDGIEPYWSEIRTFVLDSADQFIPQPPSSFSIEPGSDFYREIMDVYEVGNNLTEEQIEIAQFWDCNPYVSHHMGHVMFGTKKITPGGHWMGITSIATKNSGADMMETFQAFTLTAVSLSDAFISCWDEKYRSLLIRPETVINQYVDHEWRPLLQTPPFPEYTSGHSVISAAAATVLTSIYGDNFSFIDSTEYEFGLPPRDFDSFYEASDEAAMSRLYGGIHYRPACEVGVDQGRSVGRYVAENVIFKK